MAQRANIVVNDRATTPVAHTFAPRGGSSSADTVYFVEAGTTPIGERKISIQTRFSSGKYRTRIRVENPTLVTEVVNGVNVPKVPRTLFAEVNFTFPDTSTDQERKDTVGFIANVLAASQTMVNATVVNLEQIW